MPFAVVASVSPVEVTALGQMLAGHHRDQTGMLVNSNEFASHDASMLSARIKALLVERSIVIMLTCMTAHYKCCSLLPT